MKMPRHSTSIPAERLTTAPYNFIPLSESVMPAKEKAPSWDHFHTGTLSGEICYSMTCLTPVYTKAAVPPRESDEDNPRYRDFFHHGNPMLPVMPGSTVRGLIRSVTSILSFSRVAECKDRRLFFRSFGRGVMADLYTRRMSENIRQAQGPHGVMQGFKSRTTSGFLTADPGKEIWYFTECYELRVPRSKLPFAQSDLYTTARRGDRIKIPNPAYQYRKVWFKAASLEKGWHLHRAKRGPGMYTWRRNVDEIKLEEPANTQGWHMGWLVITGDIQRKGAEFVFVTKPGSKQIRIPDGVIKDAQDTDQISYWQERAWPHDGKFDLPNTSLLPGLPIWVLSENQSIIGIGRTQNFRLRYDHRTSDFIPTQHREKFLDFTERLFGIIRRNSTDEEDQVRGRVRFSDAPCATPNPYLEPASHGHSAEGYRVPMILGGPKPTAFQNYLEQPECREDLLTHYSTQRTGRLRGHKFYWHKNQHGLNGREALPQDAIFKATLEAGSQETVIRPVSPGTRFEGKITFDNLDLAELGALLCAIDLPDGLAHKIGMGKPIGLGSVRLKVESIRLIDREKRYRSWTEATACNSESVTKDSESREAFRKLVVEHYNQKEDPESPLPFDIDLWEMPRVYELACMLSWKQAPEQMKTRYVGLSGDDGLAWRYRKVLPVPQIPAGRPIRPVLKGPRLLASIGELPTGLQIFRLIKPIGNRSWQSILFGSDKTYDVTKVDPSHKCQKDDFVQALVRSVNGQPVISYVKKVAVPDPDQLPGESRVMAEILSIEEGFWTCRLVGGKSVWQLRGNAPQGIDVSVGSKVPARIVRKDGNNHLVFVMESS